VTVRGRVAGAVLALVGLMGTSALAGVTALHVDLEHGHSHDLEIPGHGHSHLATGPRHGHGPDHGHAHPAETPEHDHALALVAHVARRSGPAPIVLLEVAAADPNVLVSLADPPRPAPVFGVGPPARAAPPVLRSVVLQV
jgi:hypothetical protein